MREEHTGRWEDGLGWKLSATASGERSSRLLNYGVTLVRIGAHHIPRRNLILVVSESAIIMTSLLVATYLRFLSADAIHEFLSDSHNWQRFLVVTAVWQLALYYKDRYNQQASWTRKARLVRVLRATVVAFLSLALVYFLVPSIRLERGLVVMAAQFSVIMMMTFHLGLGDKSWLRGAYDLNRGAIAHIANTFTEIGSSQSSLNLARSSARVAQRKSNAVSGIGPAALEPPRLKVFLCHASGDKQAVRELYDRLTTDGFLPWLDQKNLIAGQDWRNEIAKAVHASDVVVVCLSKSSVTKEGYVQKEIRLALDVEEEKPEGTIFIIPARLEAVQVPDRLARWQWVNLFDPGGYSDLVRALKSRHSINIQSAPNVPEPQLQSTNTIAENEFTEAMYAAYHESKKLKYNPARFLQMLSGKGALATAKLLLAGDIDDISEGFTTLWELNRLDLAVEAICLRPEFRGLFNEKELSIARKRLERVGYQSF